MYLLIFGCAGSSLLTGFSLVATSGGYSLVAMHGLLIAVASLIVEHRVQGTGRSSWMRDLPRPGTEPLSSALAGRFFTTEPPRKSHKCPSWNPCVPWRIVENWSIYFYMCCKFLTIQWRTQILGSDSVMFHRVGTLMSPAPRSCTGVFLMFQKPLWPLSVTNPAPAPRPKANRWADI